MIATDLPWITCFRGKLHLRSPKRIMRGVDRFRIIEHLSRISATQVTINEQQQQNFREQYKSATGASTHGFSLPPSLSTGSIAAAPTSTGDPPFPLEYALKRQSLECLIDVLQSLVSWSQKGLVDALQE